MPCDGKGLTRVYKSGSIYVRLNDDSLGSKKVCDGELSTIQHRVEAQCRKYIRFREGGGGGWQVDKSSQVLPHAKEGAIHSYCYM